MISKHEQKLQQGFPMMDTRTESIDILDGYMG